MDAVTLTPAARAALRLQAALDKHAGWNLEADIRDVVAGFNGIAEENAALHRKIDAVHTVARHLREEADQSQYAMYESAYTTAAEWVQEALDGP